MKMREFTRCTRCIMDVTVPSIQFDENGVCNFCTEALAKLAINSDKKLNKKAQLDELVSHILSTRKSGKKYDCIIGLSGGVDSSYVAYLVKKLGLTPLAIHLDNGWNSDLAVTNIEKLVKNLDIDLFTYVINWDEFKNLQLSFLKSPIANCEIPTDHAITAILFKIAAQYDIKYIIHGGNSSSESIMPRAWMEDAFDLEIIKSVQKKYGKVKLKTFPQMGYPKLAYYFFIKRIRYIGILNYIDYDKENAIGILENELSWTRYSGKHFESIFTRWFQGYYLVEKYNIDKRIAHYSSLIVAGQLSRETALARMKDLPYDKSISDQDNQYICKKFDLSNDEFQAILKKRDDGFKYSSIYQDLLGLFKNAIPTIKKFVGKI